MPSQTGSLPSESSSAAANSLPDPPASATADSLPEAAASAAADSYEPGSREDFDRLYLASYQRILYTALAIVGDYAAAEDCAQEAFIRAYQHWKEWKPDAPAEAWLHRITLNVAFSYRRWRRLREVGEILRRFGGPRPEPEAEPGMRSDLLDALRRLAPEQAAVIILRHHHGYSNREIALALNVPESTIASRLATAKRRLREELQ